MFSWFRQHRRTKKDRLDVPDEPARHQGPSQAGQEPGQRHQEPSHQELSHQHPEPGPSISEQYDEALEAAGVALVQPAAEPGAFHVSAAVGVLLGHDPAALSRPGGLRWLVHPDDLHLFDTRFDTAGGSLPHSPVALRMWGHESWLPVLITGASAAEPAAIVSAPREQPSRVDNWFAGLVERSPSMYLVFGFTDEQRPDTLVLKAANSSGRRALKLRDGHDPVAVSAVLHEGSSQLLCSLSFDVVHTGRTMTLERITLAEFPGSYLDLRAERLADGHLAVVLHDVTATVVLEDHLRRRAAAAQTSSVQPDGAQTRAVEPGPTRTSEVRTSEVLTAGTGLEDDAGYVDLRPESSDRPVGVDHS